jgi:hypothetical protein
MDTLCFSTRIRTPSLAFSCSILAMLRESFWPSFCIGISLAVRQLASKLGLEKYRHKHARMLIKKKKYQQIDKQRHITKKHASYALERLPSISTKTQFWHSHIDAILFTIEGGWCVRYCSIIWIIQICICLDLKYVAWSLYSRCVEVEFYKLCSDGLCCVYDSFWYCT